MTGKTNTARTEPPTRKTAASSSWSLSSRPSQESRRNDRFQRRPTFQTRYANEEFDDDDDDDDEDEVHGESDDDELHAYLVDYLEEKQLDADDGHDYDNSATCE